MHQICLTELLHLNKCFYEVIHYYIPCFLLLVSMYNFLFFQKESFSTILLSIYRNDSLKYVTV